MDPRQVDLTDVEAINSLDTARMTLRWALERLRALELANADLEARLAESEKAKGELGKERESAKAALEGGAEERRRKELYYRRMEELLNSYCRGQLDVGELARRQAELDEIKRETAEFQARLEQEHAARRLELEAEHRRLAAGLTARAEAETKAVRESAEQARRLWEKDFGAREGSLRTREARLAAREKAIDERQAALEADVLDRRRALEDELGRRRDRLEEEHRLRLEAWTQERAAREDALERAWRAEEAALREKASAWEERAREYLGRVLELEGRLLEEQAETLRRVDGLEEPFGRATRELSLRRRVLDQEINERERRAEEDRAAAAEALARWRAGMEEVLRERFAELERETRARQERWQAHERELKSREVAWGEDSYRRQQELESKAKAVEELRRSLLETIKEYKERKSKEGGQGR